MEKKSEFYVYRYTDRATKAVVYIGKTNCSLKARVDAHKREAAFRPYQCDIDCVRLSNSVETDSVEKFLINYYKPCINLKDKVPMLTKDVSLKGLVWIPYEEYLASLKNNKARASVLKKEALKMSNILDIIICMCADTVVHGPKDNEVPLPELVSHFPTLDGYYQFARKEVTKNGEDYVHTILPGAPSYLEEHYFEVLSSIWRPVVQLWDLSDSELPDFAACEYAYEAIDLLKSFAREGYQSEDYPERFVALLPSKYACAIPLIERGVGDIHFQEMWGKIAFEWSHEQDSKLREALESVSKEFVRLVRSDGIWE